MVLIFGCTISNGRLTNAMIAVILSSAIAWRITSEPAMPVAPVMSIFIFLQKGNKFYQGLISLSCSFNNLPQHNNNTLHPLT